MGTRAGASIRLKSRTATGAKLVPQPYRYLPWVDDAYDRFPWYDVTLSREDLLDAEELLDEKRKPRNKFEAVGQFLATAGLRSEAYFEVTGDGRIWGREMDSIAENHRNLVAQSPNAGITITVPKDFRLVLSPDSISLYRWHNFGENGAFGGDYGVRFSQKYARSNDRYGDPDPLPIELEEERSMSFDSWSEQPENARALRAALRLVFDYHRRRRKSPSGKK